MSSEGTVYIKFKITKGLTHRSSDVYSPQSYDLVPIREDGAPNMELEGDLSMVCKPVNLPAFRARYGNSIVTSEPSGASSRGKIYEPVKEGDLQKDIGGMVESLTGKEAGPFVSFFTELLDDVFRPTKKGDR